MNFELLPNEIFLELFDYFDGVELFHIFYNLNERFKWLLYKQYRTFRFNFISISKRKFDLLCQQHLPTVTDRIVSLSLSNGIETPQQIDFFFSSISSMNDFIHLRSLTLSYIYTSETTMKIINQCTNLYCLNRLKFHHCNFIIKRSDFQSIIDSIWSLPKLIHCEMDDIAERRLGFCTPTKVSTSLQRLTWVKFIVKLNDINTLYEYTPNLGHLSISISDPHIDYQPSILPTLNSLYIVFHTFDLLDIVSFLRSMPNLYRLNIDLLFNIIDGYQLEEIIRDYLSKLRRFDFQMKNTFDSNENMEELINAFLDPFRTSFWIEEHQWFVRCFSCRTTIYLTTLSNKLKSHTDKFPDLFLSTQSTDDLQSFCNDLVEISDETFFDNAIPSHIRLTNIRYLTIQFPINDQFWSMVSTLDKLNSLMIYVNTNTTQFELDMLFDRVSHLYRLSINETVPLSVQISSLKSLETSIQQLDIQGCESFLTEEDDWSAILHSSLVMNCEVLFVQIDHRQNILNLINNLSNLRALIIRYEEENASAETDIVQWLTKHLPSTYSIARDLDFGKPICIWK